jgi:UDP-3-O-[3-hydroxymyristoyl] glucosamine N-acyltransferase LpxD
LQCHKYNRRFEPRLAFIQVLTWLEAKIGFSTYDFESRIHNSVQLGQNVVIEKGVRVGRNSIIDHNVVIKAGTTIGENCYIGASTTIGSDGFGYERDESKTPIKFPHLGGVRIGNNVELGSLNSIVRGTLSDTIINDSVKTDNLVHIAHNCEIGINVLLTACTELSGGVKIGKNTWMGPNCSVNQKINIGEDAFVGLAAVVTKDVKPSTVVAGSPAKFIRSNE